MPRNNSKPNQPTTYTPNLLTLRDRLANQEWTFIFLDLGDRVLVSWIATTPTLAHRFTNHNCTNHNCTNHNHNNNINNITRCPYCHSLPPRQISTFGTRTYDSLSMRDVSFFIQNYGTLELRNLIIELGRLNEEVAAERLGVLRSGRGGRGRGRR